jgi:hypothetical protein
MDDQPLTQGGINFIGEDYWRIEAYGDKSILSSVQELLRKVVLCEAAESTVWIFNEIVGIVGENFINFQLKAFNLAIEKTR